MNKRNMRRDLDMTMEKIRLSPARRTQIMQSVRPRRRVTIRTAGRIAAAIVLAVLLTFSAFAAAIPALREALQNALGSFTEQSQTITGIAAEDNGIEVRPVAALSDSGMTCVYVEIEDQTGDRLSGGYEVSIEISHPQDDQPVHLGTSASQISYDAETHTALYKALRPDSIAAQNPSAVVDVWLLDPQAANGKETIGHWSFETELERAAERCFTPDAAVNGYRVFEVRVSALSLTLLIENGVTDPTQPDYHPINYASMPLSLTLHDGTVIAVTENEANRILATDTPPSDDPQTEAEHYYHSEVQWLFDQPVQPDAVTAITIGDVDVPLQ